MTDPSAPLRDLATLGLDVPWPDPDAERGAREHRLPPAPGRPVSPLGALARAAEWLAGVQGVHPPRPPRDVRLVVVTSTHLGAGDGRTLDDAGVATASLAAGGTPVQQLAAAQGVQVELVDAGEIGDVAVEDAGLVTSVVAGVDHGAELVDGWVDEGADLLVLTAVSPGGSTAAAALVAVLTGSEPVAVAGRGSGLDDAGWAVKTAAIRDARRRGQEVRHETEPLLAAVGGRDIAVLAGMVLQASRRRVPVLLDGVSAVAAALVARDVSPRISRWIRLAHASTELAEQLTVERTGLVPLLDLELSGVGVTAGLGGLLAVPLLQAAARLADAPLRFAPEPPPDAEDTDRTADTDDADDATAAAAETAAAPAAPVAEEPSADV